MCWRTDRWVPPTERAGSEGSYTVWRQTAGILYSRKQKGGRRFAAGCIEGLCSLRSRGDGGKIVFSNARGFRRLRRPGSSRHWVAALDGSGSAHRAGRFRGSYKVWRQTAGILYSRKPKRAPLRGRLYRRVMFASLKGRWGKTVFPKVRRFRRHAAPGFYRSCAGALIDGFGPGTAAPSGLVQRGVIMPPVGGSRGAAIKLIARQGDTTPSEPFEPFEPSEPGPQSGPTVLSRWRHGTSGCIIPVIHIKL